MGSTGQGRLIIISGPSGAGKSTVVRHLLQECDLPLTLSISATTRPPRVGEQDGNDYFFMDQDEFDRRREAGEFLESKEVFGLGYWYGTLRQQVASGLSQGRWVILEIDVQGALAVLDQQDLDPITVFIHPGGMEELEQRLRNRETESEEVDLCPPGNGTGRDAVHVSISIPSHQWFGRHCRCRDLSNIESPKGKTSMLEELKEEEIVNKVGGRFKLSTLIQKRLVQLNQGSRALGQRRHARQDVHRASGNHAGQDRLEHGQRGRADDGLGCHDRSCRRS